MSIPTERSAYPQRRALFNPTLNHIGVVTDDLDRFLAFYQTTFDAPVVRETSDDFLIVSSAAALVPSPLLAPYAAAKAGIEALGRSARIELADLGVGVGVAYVGLVHTPLMTEAIEQNTEYVRALPPNLTRRLSWLKTGPTTISPDEAAIAFVRGLRRRSAHVYTHRSLRLVFATRGLVTPVDAVLHRLPQLKQMLSAARSAPSDQSHE